MATQHYQKMLSLTQLTASSSPNQSQGQKYLQKIMNSKQQDLRPSDVAPPPPPPLLSFDSPSSFAQRRGGDGRQRPGSKEIWGIDRAANDHMTGIEVTGDVSQREQQGKGRTFMDMCGGGDCSAKAGAAECYDRGMKPASPSFQSRQSKNFPTQNQHQRCSSTTSINTKSKRKASTSPSRAKKHQKPSATFNTFHAFSPSSVPNKTKRPPRPPYTLEQEDFIWFHRDDLENSWNSVVALYNQHWHPPFYGHKTFERSGSGLQSRYYRILDFPVKERKKNAEAKWELGLMMCTGRRYNWMGAEVERQERRSEEESVDVQMQDVEEDIQMQDAAMGANDREKVEMEPETTPTPEEPIPAAAVAQKPLHPHSHPTVTKQVIRKYTSHSLAPGCSSNLAREAPQEENRYTYITPANRAAIFEKIRNIIHNPSPAQQIPPPPPVAPDGSEHSRRSRESSLEPFRETNTWTKITSSDRMARFESLRNRIVPSTNTPAEEIAASYTTGPIIVDTSPGLKTNDRAWLENVKNSLLSAVRTPPPGSIRISRRVRIRRGASASGGVEAAAAAAVVAAVAAAEEDETTMRRRRRRKPEEEGEGGRNGESIRSPPRAAEIEKRLRT